jgi:hypothetical protein
MRKFVDLLFTRFNLIFVDFQTKVVFEPFLHFPLQIYKTPIDLLFPPHSVTFVVNFKVCRGVEDLFFLKISF